MSGRWEAEILQICLFTVVWKREVHSSEIMMRCMKLEFSSNFCLESWAKAMQFSLSVHDSLSPIWRQYGYIFSFLRKIPNCCVLHAHNGFKFPSERLWSAENISLSYFRFSSQITGLPVSSLWEWLPQSRWLCYQRMILRFNGASVLYVVKTFLWIAVPPSFSAIQSTQWAFCWSVWLVFRIYTLLSCCCFSRQWFWK